PLRPWTSVITEVETSAGVRPPSSSTDEPGPGADAESCTAEASEPSGRATSAGVGSTARRRTLTGFAAGFTGAAVEWLFPPQAARTTTSGRARTARRIRAG